MASSPATAAEELHRLHQLEDKCIDALEHSPDKTTRLRALDLLKRIQIVRSDLLRLN